MDQRVCGCVDGFLACAQKKRITSEYAGGAVLPELQAGS